MALIPHDADLARLLRQIRQEIAQDRTDIQRLMRVMRRAEFLEYPVPEVYAAGESSSVSASMSESESLSSSIGSCAECNFPFPLTVTVTQSAIGSDTYIGKLFGQIVGTHNLYIHAKVYPSDDDSVLSDCITISADPPEITSTEYLRLALRCRSTLALWRLSWSTSGCPGFPGATTPFTRLSFTCDPFYLLEEFSDGNGNTFHFEITE